MDLIKKAFSTNAFTDGRFSLIDAVIWLADLGYGAVEILMDRPLLWPFNITFKEIEHIKKVIAENNLEISCLNAFTCCGYWFEAGKLKQPPGQKFGPCFCDYEEEYRQQRIDYTKKVIDLAVEFNAKDVSTSSGYQPMRGNREMAWRNMINGLKEATAYAEEKKIRLNIEPEPGCLVGSVKEGIQAVREVNSPLFGINADIGHLFISEKNVLGAVRWLMTAIPDKIHSVHFEDICVDDHGRPVHYHVIPGDGDMPLKEIVQMLKGYNYQGWYTVELYTQFKHPVKAARKTMKYFKKLEIELG